MTGLPLILAFVLAVVVMIVAISKFKVHPFLAIMAVSMALALVAGILAYYVIEFGNDMYAFVKSDEQIEIEIPEYATVEEISTLLGDSGVIKYPNLMIIYSKLKKIDETYNFKAGIYTVNGMMNYDELLAAFKKKAPSGISRITIPEGYTTDEIIDLFPGNSGFQDDDHGDSSFGQIRRCKINSSAVCSLRSRNLFFMAPNF